MKGFKTNGFIVTLQGSNIVKGILVFIFSLLIMFSITGAITSLKPGLRISSTPVSTITINVPSETLMHVLGFENHHFTQGLPKSSNSPNLFSTIFEAATNINLDDPRSLLGRELPGFSIFDGKILVAGEGTNYTNMPIESSPPLEVLLEEREAATKNLEQLEKPTDEHPVSPPELTTGDKNVVFIYHTHSWESYLPHLDGIDTKNANSAVHNTVNVTKVGEMLQEELKARGIGAEADTRNMHKYRIEKGYKYSQNYKLSGEVMASAMAKNKDLAYFIDIHRDSRRKKDTTKVINGKSYAKIAFVVGTENPQFEKNFALANKLHKLIDKKYPGLSRGVLENGGPGNNGVYNQDKSENAMLIEFGGVDNNFEELRRSAEAVADIFAEFYWQAKGVSADPEKEERIRGNEDDKIHDEMPTRRIGFTFGVLFGMQQANEGMKKMRGYDDPSLQGAFHITNNEDGEVEASVLGKSHDLSEKQRQLEEVEAFNIFSTIGKKLGEVISMIFEQLLALLGSVVEALLDKIG